MNWEGFKLLEEYVEKRIGEYGLIPKDRKEALGQLADSIREEITSHDRASLIFICTHNSRRSHLGHLWAQMAAAFYQVKNIFCYSGGTEAIAFNERVARVLEEAGMAVSKMDESPNPVYLVNFPGSGIGINTFSKRYSDPPNPSKDFIAIMTCSDADEACPIVHGAISRHAIRYEDPKVSDGTIAESTTYHDRSSQIAREMLYLFSLI